jgi:hypothetical protein
VTSTTHRYELKGEILETYAFHGPAREWSEFPDRSLEGWQVLRFGRVVQACRVARPTAILRRTPVAS